MADTESPPQVTYQDACEWLRAHGFAPDPGSSRWNGPAGEIGRVTDRTILLGSLPKPCIDATMPDSGGALTVVVMPMQPDNPETWKAAERTWAAGVDATTEKATKKAA